MFCARSKNLPAASSGAEGKQGIENMAEWVTLTRAMVDEGMSVNGGFGLRQLRCLGTTWKDNPGWLGRLVGTRALRKNYETFLALKN